MIGEVSQSFAYNRWANQRVLDAAEALNTQDYTRDLGGSYASIRDTLIHILAAEWIWVQRWNGASPTEMPDWDLSTIPALRARWAEVEAEQTAFVEPLGPADLERIVRYSNTQGQPFAEPLSAQLRHVVNHSTHHRGQITTMLRQLHIKPPTTDFIAFVRETTPNAEY